MDKDELPIKRENPQPHTFDLFVLAGIGILTLMPSHPELMLPINDLIPRIDQKSPEVIFLSSNPLSETEKIYAKKHNFISCKGKFSSELLSSKEMIKLLKILLKNFQILFEKMVIIFESLSKEDNCDELTNQATLENTEENKSQLKNLKKTSGKIILRLHGNLVAALQCLALPRREQNFIENNYENCLALMIFHFCHFCFTHINLENICKYFNLLAMLLSPKMISMLMLNFKQMSPVVKVMILDLWLQIFYVKNQFRFPEDILSYLCSLTLQKRINSLAQSTSNILVDIFNSKILKSYYKPTDDALYSKQIKEFLECVHFIDLPNSINGLTTFARYVLISTTKTKAVQRARLILGYKILVILHESAQFIIRNGICSDKGWIEFSTPKRVIEVDSDSGNDLENEIFGNSPNFITENGAEFLLNLTNWESDLSDFRSNFAEANRMSVLELKNLTNPSYICMKSSSASSFIILGQCSKAYGRRNKLVNKII